MDVAPLCYKWDWMEGRCDRIFPGRGGVHCANNEESGHESEIYLLQLRFMLKHTWRDYPKCLKSMICRLGRCQRRGRTKRTQWSRMRWRRGRERRSARPKMWVCFSYLWQQLWQDDTLWMIMKLFGVVLHPWNVAWSIDSPPAEEPASKICLGSPFLLVNGGVGVTLTERPPFIG